MPKPNREWWAEWRVVYPDAARATIAAVPNFVRVEGAPVEEGFVEELRLLEDSTRKGGRALARLLIMEAWDRLRVVAESEGDRDHARRVVEMLLGNALRFEGSGGG